MAEKRELEYRDTFVLYLQQTLTDRFDAEPDFPTLPFTDLTTRLQLTVEVNAREYTQILSSIMTGADLAFPDIAHELELIWTYAKENTLILPKAISMYRQTSQAVISAASWGAIIPEFMNDPDSAIASLNMTNGIFTFNQAGKLLVSVMMHARNAATAQSQKQVRLFNVTDFATVLDGSPAQINASAIERNWLAISGGLLSVSAGDQFKFELKATANSNTTIEADPQIEGRPSLPLQISMVWFP